MGPTSKKALTFPRWGLGDDHQAPRAHVCAQNKCFVREQSSELCVRKTHTCMYTQSVAYMNMKQKACIYRSRSSQAFIYT